MYSIRKKSMLLFSIFLALTCLLVPAAADPGNPVGRVLTVGVPTDRCPVFYPDPDTGEIVGIGVDLMRSAAEEAGFAVSFQRVEEPTLKDALDNPAYDLVMPFGSALQSASGKASIVSDNLIQTPFTLVTEGRRQMPSLNELRVGMLKSLAAGAETVRGLYPGIEILLYETMPECVSALRKGEVDALLHNSYVWSYVLQKPSYSDLTVHPDAMFSMDFRAATPDTPDGRELIGRLNEGIARVPDTRRSAITLDYTSRKLYRYDFFDYLHLYGLVILFGILLIIALILINVYRVRAIRLEQEEKMRLLIDHDPLTGALSLNGFRKKVNELLREHPDTKYLLTFINIKNFKYINDSLGKETGDELLRFYISKTLSTLTEKDAVCRIEADHFAVLRHFMSEEILRQDDQKVIDAVRNYFLNRGKEYRVQVCGGIYVLTPEDYQKIDVDHMLDLARITEKKVSETIRDGYAFYNPEQWEKGKLAADIVNLLPIAILSEEIKVWYQPQVDFSTGEIIGAEALCRWQHPELGWLSPAAFIPALEEAGLIYKLDRFVWGRVCQDLNRWKEQGIRMSVSVNVSRKDILENRNIPGDFTKLVETYGLSANQLRIEVTETAFAENPSLLIRTTKQLGEFGFQVEMDDFGSGYSSLHMLKEMPVDRIKLDLNFLTSSGDPEKGRIIISHIIQMVRSLGMTLIAEGVETKEQADFLFGQGCADMQGFYFYKPMPVGEFEKLLKKP